MESQKLSRKGILKRSREGWWRDLSQSFTLFCLFKGLLTVFILLFFPFFSVITLASPYCLMRKNLTALFSKENKYQPYLEVGGIKYFNQESKAAGIYDVFLPFSSSSSNQATTLFFSDVRIFDRSGSSFEGNAHLGYRVLLPETHSGKNQLFGVYASFDRRKSEKKNFYNQITIGGEFWYDKWFIGGNLYTPIGKKKRLTSDTLPSETQPVSWKEKGRSLGKVIEYTGTITTTKTKHIFEKSLYGLDAEVGYAFLEQGTDQITGYAGGYWFQDGFFESAKKREAKTKWGPRFRLTYDYLPVHSQRFLGILDGVSLEAGIQHDKPRGTSGYIGFKIKAGLTHSQKTTSNLSGFERHITELVRRDPDIVLNETKTTETTTILKEGIELSNHQGYVSFPKEEPIESPETLEFLLFQFGLSPDATEQEIRKKYRNYAKQYHPDKNKEMGATEKFIYYTHLYDLIQEKREQERRRALVQNSHHKKNHKNHHNKHQNEEYSSDLAQALVPFVSPVPSFPPVPFASSHVSYFSNVSKQSSVVSHSHSVSYSIFSSVSSVDVRLNQTQHSKRTREETIIRQQKTPDFWDSQNSLFSPSPQSFLSLTGEWLVMPFRWIDYGVNTLLDMLIPIKGVNAQFNMPNFQLDPLPDPLIHVRLPNGDIEPLTFDNVEFAVNLGGLEANRLGEFGNHLVLYNHQQKAALQQIDKSSQHLGHYQLRLNEIKTDHLSGWIVEKNYPSIDKLLEEERFIQETEKTIDKSWESILEAESVLSKAYRATQAELTRISGEVLAREAALNQVIQRLGRGGQGKIERWLGMYDYHSKAEAKKMFLQHCPGLPERISLREAQAIREKIQVQFFTVQQEKGKLEGHRRRLMKSEETYTEKVKEVYQSQFSSFLTSSLLWQGNQERVQRGGVIGELEALDLKKQIANTFTSTLHLELHVDLRDMLGNQFEQWFLERWTTGLPESLRYLSINDPNDADNQESSSIDQKAILDVLRGKAAEGDWITTELAMERLIRQEPSDGFDTEGVSRSIWETTKERFNRKKWDNLVERVKHGGGVPTGWFSFKNINRALFIDEISKSAVVGCPLCTEQLIEGYIKATGEQPHYLASIARIEAWGGTNVQYWDKIYPRVVAHWEKYQTEQKGAFSSIQGKIEKVSQTIFRQIKTEEKLADQVTEFVKKKVESYKISQAVIGGIASAQMGLQYGTQLEIYSGLFDLFNTRENKEALRPAVGEETQSRAELSSQVAREVVFSVFDSVKSLDLDLPSPYKEFFDIQSEEDFHTAIDKVLGHYKQAGVQWRETFRSAFEYIQQGEFSEATKQVVGTAIDNILDIPPDEAVNILSGALTGGALSYTSCKGLSKIVVGPIKKLSGAPGKLLSLVEGGGTTKLCQWAAGAGAGSGGLQAEMYNQAHGEGGIEKGTGKSGGIKNIDEVASKIANGHAFDKHILGKSGHISGIKTKKELAEHIKKIISKPDDFKALKNGRSAYWHEESKTVVICDSKHIDGGSVFRSNKDYFKEKII